MRAGASVVLVVLCTVLAACGGSKSASVIGSWQGTLTQRGLAPFTVSATVKSLSAPSGNTVRYGGIDCHGRWTYRGRAGSAYRFRELITGGQSTTCKGVGTVKLTPSGSRMRYEFRAGGVVSRGLLSRTG